MGINEQFMGIAPATAGGGKVVQVVNVLDNALATTADALPYDDTIPQNDEGAEVMSLAITPKNENNLLKIEVVAMVACSTAGAGVAISLFQDAAAGAISAIGSIGPSANQLINLTLTYYMTAGTTLETTFKVMAGASAGTLSFNGASAARLYGGVAGSSITITEIAA